MEVMIVTFLLMIISDMMLSADEYILQKNNECCVVYLRFSDISGFFLLIDFL